MGTFEAIGTYVIKNERLKAVLFGLILLTGGFLLWYSAAGNPINELALIRRGVIAKGVIKDAGDSDYEFRLPNGQMVEGKTGEIAYYMPGYVIEVEYLPDNPAVSRIKGDGCSTVTEWLWRKAGLGGLLLVLFTSPGAILIYREFYPRPEKTKSAA